MSNKQNKEFVNRLQTQPIESRDIETQASRKKDRQYQESENILDDDEIQREEEIKDAEEKNGKVEIKEEQKERMKQLKIEQDKKDVQEFFRELIEEEPLEGVLKPPIEKEIPKETVIETPQKKTRKTKPKEEIPEKKIFQFVVKKHVSKEIIETPEQQEKRELAEFLEEINEGQETGVLELSSSGRNSRQSKVISEKENITNKKEKPKVNKVEKESSKVVKVPQNIKGGIPVISCQQETVNKQEIRELFKQLEEMQEEGVLKPTNNQNDKPSSQYNTIKEETPSKKKIRTPVKEQKKSTHSTTPVTQQTPQEVQVFNEKEEVRELFRQLEEVEEEGLLHASSSGPQLQRPTSQMSKQKEKVIKESKLPKTPEKPKETKPIQIQNVSIEPQLSPEEQEKKELKEFFRQLEEEQEEGVLQLAKEAYMTREPSVLSKKSVKSTKSEEISTKSEENSSKVEKLKSKLKQKNPQYETQILSTETPEEQERRELKELFLQLEQEEEEGLLRLPNEKCFSGLSTISKQKERSISHLSTSSKQIERSPSKMSNNSKQKNRQVSQTSTSSKQKTTSVRH